REREWRSRPVGWPGRALRRAPPGVVRRRLPRRSHKRAGAAPGGLGPPPRSRPGRGMTYGPLAPELPTPALRPTVKPMFDTAFRVLLLCALAAILGPDPAAAAEPAGVVASDGNAFAFDLYGRLRSAQSGNLFFSPHSISTALAMTYDGARGDTAAEMART